MPLLLHFFGGHADGLEREFEGSEPPLSLKVATPKDCPHPEAGPFTLYNLSPDWSRAMGKIVMLVDRHPGKPPREKAAA